ncbi:MAG TPA: hypothetical protein VGI81_25130 [Tepidisphaeraceae bacterium]
MAAIATSKRAAPPGCIAPKPLNHQPHREPNSDQQEFWVTQLSAGVLTALQARVRQAGGHLEGVCHPGGLPALFRHRDVPPGLWRRVEVWKRATLCVRGGDGAAVAGSVRIINATSDQPSWERWIQQWLGATAAEQSEWLGGGAERDRGIGAGPPDVRVARPPVGRRIPAWLPRAGHVAPLRPVAGIGQVATNPLTTGNSLLPL